MGACKDIAVQLAGKKRYLSTAVGYLPFIFEGRLERGFKTFADGTCHLALQPARNKQKKG